MGILILVLRTVVYNDDMTVHFISGATAFLIGWLLHYFKMWRGGDAKLFALYALLMPSLENDGSLYSSGIHLFLNAFVFAFIVLIPISIKDLLSDRKRLAENLFAPQNAKRVINVIGSTILISWIISPAAFWIKQAGNPIILALFTMLIFRLAFKIPERFLKNPIYVLGAVFMAFLLRFYLIPSSLSFTYLSHTLFYSIFFCGISTCFYAVLRDSQMFQERVPFAPMLFCGCLLSYTSFLKIISHLLYH